MLFKSEASGEWRPHPVLATIPDDDPELTAILPGIKTPVVSINQMLDAGPHRKTVLYDHAKPYAENSDRVTGILETWTSMGRRYAFALAYAKYLLCLKLLGEARQRSRPGRHSSHAATSDGTTAPAALSVAPPNPE